MEEQSEYDFLNYTKDHHINASVTRGEKIEFSDTIIKINKYGFKQNRNIIITDKAVYNLKKTSLRRRIDLKSIKGITLSKTCNEFVIHCKDEEYDYQYVSAKKKDYSRNISKRLF